jgi:hypothetical protein
VHPPFCLSAPAPARRRKAEIEGERLKRFAGALGIFVALHLQSGYPAAKLKGHDSWPMTDKT